MWQRPIENWQSSGTCLRISSVTRWTPRCCGLRLILVWNQPEPIWMPRLEEAMAMRRWTVRRQTEGAGKYLLDTLTVERAPVSYSKWPMRNPILRWLRIIRRVRRDIIYRALEPQKKVRLWWRWASERVRMEDTQMKRAKGERRESGIKES